MRIKKYLPYAVSVLIALAVGWIGSLTTASGMQAYEQLVKPPLTPPSAVFPIVWTALYALMGIGAALVWKSDHPVRGTALTIYVVQLLFNCLWSILFFGLGAYFISFVWLLALLLLIVAMTVSFYKTSPTAGYLQVPYLIWVSFAGYLNLGIWWLNR